MIKLLWLALLACISMSQALASEVSISDAWTKASAPGQGSATVSLRITSKKDAQIIAVSTTASRSAEIHSMIHENGMMKMRALDSLELKANQEVILGHGGMHLMLVDLIKPLVTGEQIPLLLTVQFADKHTEKINVNAMVKSLYASNSEHMHH